MTYRTRTYIAAEWDGDRDAIEQLHKWNDSNHWSLGFTDAHDLTQSRDSSLNCSIKSSLKKRLDSSKTFVLIVGSNTNNVRAGSCQYCQYYCRNNKKCLPYHSPNFQSFIDYECLQAIKANIKIVVLYNAASVNKNKCPEIIRNHGVHKAMCYFQHGSYYWDYQEVKAAFED